MNVGSVEEMEELGERIGAQSHAGDVIVLVGPLGAGKTALTRGIGRALQVTGAVTSPTFVISRVHAGPTVSLVHVDAYRLGDDAHVDDLELDDYLTDSVVVIEWGDAIVGQLTDTYLLVTITPVSETDRDVTVTGVGQRWQDVAV